GPRSGRTPQGARSRRPGRARWSGRPGWAAGAGPRRDGEDPGRADAGAGAALEGDDRRPVHRADPDGAAGTAAAALIGKKSVAVSAGAGLLPAYRATGPPPPRGRRMHPTQPLYTRRGVLASGLALGGLIFAAPGALAADLARTPPLTEGPFYPD